MGLFAFKLPLFFQFVIFIFFEWVISKGLQPSAVCLLSSKVLLTTKTIVFDYAIHLVQICMLTNVVAAVHEELKWSEGFHVRDKTP